MGNLERTRIKNEQIIKDLRKKNAMLKKENEILSQVLILFSFLISLVILWYSMSYIKIFLFKINFILMSKRFHFQSSVQKEVESLDLETLKQKTLHLIEMIRNRNGGVNFYGDHFSKFMMQYLYLFLSTKK